MTPPAKARSTVPAWPVLTVLPLVLAIVWQKGLDPAYPDAARHALNGVFIHDWFGAGCPAPMPFARAWYDRFPGLSLGYHPPLVPLVAAPLHALLGPGWLAARLTTLVFVFLGTVAAWHWLPRHGGRALAAFSLLLLWGSPQVLRWGADPMLEVPALGLLLVALVTWLCFLREGSRRMLLVALFAGAAACYARQNAGLVFVVFALSWLWERGPRGPFSRRGNIRLNLSSAM